MKAKAPIVPGTLRRLFLRISRASVACVAGCVVTHVENTEDTQEEGGAAQAPEPGTWLAAPDAAAASICGRAPVPVTPAGDVGMILHDEGVGWERIAACDEPASPSELHTTRPIDAIGVYVEGALDPAARVAVEIARAGTPCSEAYDRTACELQVERVKQMWSCPDAVGRFAIAGAGSAYARVNTSAELRALLGSIDSAAEARLLAAFEEYDWCFYTDSGPLGPPRHEVRATEQGYELRTSVDSPVCGPPSIRQRVSVTTDGTISAAYVRVRVACGSP